MYSHGGISQAIFTPDLLPPDAICRTFHHAIIYDNLSRSGLYNGRKEQESEQLAKIIPRSKNGVFHVQLILVEHTLLHSARWSTSVAMVEKMIFSLKANFVQPWKLLAWFKGNLRARWWPGRFFPIGASAFRKAGLVFRIKSGCWQIVPSSSTEIGQTHQNRFKKRVLPPKACHSEVSGLASLAIFTEMTRRVISSVSVESEGVARRFYNGILGLRPRIPRLAALNSLPR